MPFPESERVFYENNPLVEVVAQLRFPPILQITSEDPSEFQNAIRDVYPDYERENPLADDAQVQEFLNSIGATPGSERITHKFQTEDGNQVISLAREFVAVTDYDYERWERLRDEIVRAQDAVEETYAPNFYKRVGLRYRDVIDRTVLGLEDVPWHELLNPSLLGLLGEGNLRGNVKQIATQIEVRVEEVEGSFATLRHGFVTKNNDTERQAYLIDADFYRQERTEGEAVLEVLNSFKRVAGNLFRWAVSDRLEEALGPMAG